VYLSLQTRRPSRFDAKARLPFKMAQGTVKGTIIMTMHQDGTDGTEERLPSAY